MNRGLWGLWAGCAVLLFGLGFQAVSVIPQRIYFPLNYLWASFDCEPYEGARGRPIVDPFEVNWFTEYWRTAHEPSLALKTATGARPSYRFTWISPLPKAGAAIIRIDETPDRSLRLTVTEMDVRAYYPHRPPHVLARRERLLSEAEAQRFRQAYRAAQIDKMAPPACRLGADGARWIVEATEGGRYHYVNRWSPKDGPVHDLGVLFGDLGGVTALQCYVALHRYSAR